MPGILSVFGIQGFRGIIQGTPYLILIEEDCHENRAARGARRWSGWSGLSAPYHCDRQMAAADFLLLDSDEFMSHFRQRNG